ncbi:MAG: hypothetical protein LBV12_13120 [Puniceicoccales bacterium]|nr:hypothetical protein [Puniceicoccales bacterium]
MSPPKMESMMVNCIHAPDKVEGITANSILSIKKIGQGFASGTSNFHMSDTGSANGSSQPGIEVKNLAELMTAQCQIFGEIATHIIMSNLFQLKEYESSNNRCIVKLNSRYD